MSTCLFILTGCDEKLLVKVEAPTLTGLVQEFSCIRFLSGRMVAVNGEATSRGVVVAVSRIGMIAEADQEDDCRSCPPIRRLQRLRALVK